MATMATASTSTSAYNPSAQHRQPYAHQPHAQTQQQQQPPQGMYPSHSVMEDLSDDDDDGRESHEDEFEDDESLNNQLNGAVGQPHQQQHHPDQNHFYHQQQQQALYYQQHQAQHGSNEQVGGPSRSLASNAHAQGQAQAQGQVMHGQAEDGLEDEDMYSDDESSTASIPDENIDFSLTYALHTFLATVEGQASVVKGDSLLLLDDANSYWWLVRVLKTEDVGYIPAENIETPYERLARLNKHRNVDLAAATVQEKQAGAVQDREKLKGLIAGKAKGLRMNGSGEGGEDGKRRVFFGAPTYIDHPGKTWSSDEEDDDEDEYEGPEDEVDESLDDAREEDIQERQGQQDVRQVDESLGRGAQEMEPDDGMEWADSAGREEQTRVIDARGAPALGNPIGAKSNNPFAKQQTADTATNQTGLDPAQATDTKRITATPAVAQAALAPSVNVQQRNVSGQSVQSVQSVSSTSSVKSQTPLSPEDKPEDKDKKAKKMRKSSKEDLDVGEKKKKGMLGGLFSRKPKNEKKGISSVDPRSSEESGHSTVVDNSPGSRFSEESNRTARAPTPADRKSPGGSAVESPVVGVSAHGLRLQQREQATQQAYANKYLTKPAGGDLVSPTASEAAAAVAQSAAAMRLAASMISGGGRPSSIIVSPNPAGPPLLNVIRVFAGEHIKSEASFKTVLLNETTSSTDLIRQAMQRFHLHPASTPGSEKNFFLTIKDVNGEEMELTASEKPLVAFLEAVQRWSEDDDPKLKEITPTVKRSSIASISSIASLSSHPAIAKLGMNDFSDDSAVKIYINRRRPGSTQSSLPDPGSLSEFSTYSTSLSTVHEASPESGTSERQARQGEASTPPMRYDPSLTINTNGPPSPERFSSPSARFTIQLLIHPSDLPDGSVFDPSSDSIIPRSVMRDRMAAGHPMTQSYPADSRRRLFVLPKNATVVEAIEQGLERFGITEGVVDGGDDVEDRRRAVARVKYSLSVSTGVDERHLSPSSKIIDAYSALPTLRPAERMTREERRRSREPSANNGVATDILPSDPVFILRRVGHLARPTPRHAAPVEERGGGFHRQQVPSTSNPSTTETLERALSPQEIIAAQRAASRANQKAIISAHTNKSQGVDLVLPDKSTLRSSRLMEPEGEVVRYSYIDGVDGETYDISELLEEEWAKDGQPRTLAQGRLAPPPPLNRVLTDSSTYVTAPSTPEPIPSDSSRDILRGVLEEDQPEDKLEEKLQRVIAKVKNSSSKSIASKDSEPLDATSSFAAGSRGGTSGTNGTNGRQTPQNGGPVLSPVVESFASSSKSTSVKGETRETYHQTAVSVNRIISRHKQQPSIASILSDIDGSGSIRGNRDDDGSSTPMTTTESSHATPPLRGQAVFQRAVSTASPIPRTPVVYQDDFGMKTLMNIIQARARPEGGSGRGKKRREADPVDKMFYGERLGEGESLHPEIKAVFAPVQTRLDMLDKEIDELLGMLMTSR